MGQYVDAAREAFKTVPPAPQTREDRNITPEAGGNGPHSLGSPPPNAD